MLSGVSGTVLLPQVLMHCAPLNALKLLRHSLPKSRRFSFEE
jgi:hypothetical protein